MHNLRNEHKILTLCRVLRVNRSTYYKHFGEVVSMRTLENQELRRLIAQIYIKSKKRFGAEKIKRKLDAEYGIKISLGRVYRLKNSIGLPSLATVKPKFKVIKKEDEIIPPPIKPCQLCGVFLRDAVRVPLAIRQIGLKYSSIRIPAPLFLASQRNPLA